MKISECYVGVGEGYDLMIDDIPKFTDGKYIASEKTVDAKNVSEEIVLAIIEKYCPLPPNKKLIVGKTLRLKGDSE